MHKAFIITRGNRIAIFLSLFTIGYISALSAQNGSIDLNFSKETGPNGSILSTAVQPDGKIILGGTFAQYGSTSAPRIVRINGDGTVDNTFQITGASFSGGNWIGAMIKAIVVQPDGKILVGGEFTSFGGQSVNRVVRLNSNGSLDNSFAAPSQLDNRVYALELLSNGQIAVGGVFSDHLIRLNTDGSYDGTFSAPVNDEVSAIKERPDGKLLVGGLLAVPQQGTLVCLNQDGSLDNTFTNTLTYASERVEDIELTTDGKIVVANYQRVYRFLLNGQHDATFENLENDGEEIQSIALQSDGKVLVVGSFVHYGNTLKNGIVRLMTDGTIDSAFNTGTGFQTSTAVMQVALLPDETIICGGYFHEYNSDNASYVVRLNTDGTLNWAVQEGEGATYTSGPDADIYTAITLPNGKIFVGGDFQYFDQVERSHVALLRSDGYIDFSFNPGTGTTTQSGDGISNGVYCAVGQQDQKIVFAGSFSGYNGGNHHGIVRIMQSGAVDNTFATGTGIQGSVYTMALQTDGKIVIAGDFYYYNGVQVGRIARLNTDGSLDTAFNTQIGTGADNRINSIAIQSDGKIVVAGQFNHFNGTNKYVLIRLNTDGSMDSTFDAPFGAGILYIKDICLQADGKIVAGGSLAISGNENVRRYNTDGSIESTFITNLPYIVNSVCMQPDGKILVGNNKVQRLLPDGTVDAQFQTHTGVNILDISLTSLDNVLVAGNCSFNSTISVTRLKTGPTQLGLNENWNDSEVIIFPNPTTGVVTLRFDTEEAKLTIFDIQGKTIFTQNVHSGDDISLSDFPEGVYLFDLLSGSDRAVKRIVKR